MSSYDDTIMEHIRNARNYRTIEPGAGVVTGEAANPLCGDTFTVFARVADGRVEDLAFQCECCGISMASASVMTAWMQGRTKAEVLDARARFEGAIRAGETRLPDAPEDASSMLGFAKATPARTGCVLIGWQALASALAGGSGE